MTVVYSVVSEEPLPRYPNVKIIDDGKVVVLEEYPTCGQDGHGDDGMLRCDRALYDVNMPDSNNNARWVYLCEDCWDQRGGNEGNYGPLGWGKSQRIVVTIGSRKRERINRRTHPYLPKQWDYQLSAQPKGLETWQDYYKSSP